MSDRFTTLAAFPETTSVVVAPQRRVKTSRRAWGRVAFCATLVLGLLGFGFVLLSSLGLAWFQGILAILFLWLMLCMVSSQ